MSRFADNLRTFWSQFLQSLTRFPVEALLGVTYFILFLFAERIDAALEGSDSLNLFLWFFPHCVLVFTLHRSSEGRPAVKALYYLSWFLWIPLLFFCTARHGSGMAIFVSYLLAAILLVVGRKRLDNGPFAREILRVVVRVGICFLIGGLLLAVVTAIISSVGFLFGLNLGEKWFEIPNVFIALNIIPLMCCSAASDERPVPRGERILQTVVDRILSPALIIYTLILYAYTVRILVRWELPDGGVAYMVSAFIAVALLCILFQPLIEKSHFTWFYKAFPALAVAPLALLWTGVFRRVSEYGLTESRVYLILFAALMTLFVAMLTTERGRRFQLMALILAAATALFTFIPGIRAKDFGIRSQQKRLEAVLPQVLEAISVLEKHGVDYNILSVVDDENAKDIETTWRYFSKHRFWFLQFIPYVDEGGARLSSEAYETFLKKVFDLWYADFQRGEYVSVRHIDNYVGVLMGRQPESCAMCGICGGYYVVEANGEVYPCDFYCREEYRLGSVFDENLFEANEKQRRFTEDSETIHVYCRPCKYYDLCRGGCRRDRTADGTKNKYCEAYYHFFEYAAERMKKAAEAFLDG